MVRASRRSAHALQSVPVPCEADRTGCVQSVPVPCRIPRPSGAVSRIGAMRGPAGDPLRNAIARAVLQTGAAFIAGGATFVISSFTWGQESVDPATRQRRAAPNRR